MSMRLGGLPALSYVGVEAVQPPNLMYFTKRAPTTNDWKNLNVGTLWLYVGNGLQELWLLTSVAGNQGTWKQLYPSSGSGATFFQGNSGPGATPAAGIISIKGAADMAGNTGVLTVAGSGAGNDIVINVVPIEYTTDDASTISPAANIVNVLGTGGITTSSAGNTITINGGTSGIDSVVTDSGTATPVANVLNIKTAVASFNCGSTVEFTGSGNNVVLNVSDTDHNTIMGKFAGNGVLTSLDSTGFGYGVFDILSTGSNNSAFGSFSGATLLTGEKNTLLGTNSGRNLISGSNNIAVGMDSASNYGLAESSNIIIGNVGTSLESNTIRIGTQGSGSGEQNSAYMAGIYGSTVGATNGVVVCDNTGKLGIANPPVSSGAWVLLNTQTVNLVRSFVFNLNPLFTTYKIMFWNVIPGTLTTSTIQARYSIDGGVTQFSPASAQGNSIIYFFGSPTPNFGSSPYLMGGHLYNGTTPQAGECTFFGLELTSNTFVQAQSHFSAFNTQGWSVWDAQGPAFPDVINAIIVSADNSSLTSSISGTFSLYGLAQ